MKNTELKIKSVAELQKLLMTTRAQLFAAQYRNSTGNLTKSHQVRQLKRQIARILSLLKIHATHAKSDPQSAKKDYQAAVNQINTETQEFRAKIKAKLQSQQTQLTANSVSGSEEQSNPDSEVLDSEVVARTRSQSLSSESDPKSTPDD